MTLLQDLFQHALAFFEALGGFGPALFIPICVLATLLFMSSSALAFVAGALFDVPLGFTLVSIAFIISAGGTFLAGRALSQKWMLKKIALDPRTKALDDAVTKEGWKMVALLRQTALLPFVVMNYVLGLSKIPFKDYFLASWLGMIPGHLLYVYLGSVAGDLALDGQPRQRTVMEWVFVGLGAAVTIGLSIRATILVRRALNLSGLRKK